MMVSLLYTYLPQLANWVSTKIFRNISGYESTMWPCRNECCFGELWLGDFRIYLLQYTEVDEFYTTKLEVVLRSCELHSSIADTNLSSLPSNIDRIPETEWFQWEFIHEISRRFKVNTDKIGWKILITLVTHAESTGNVVLHREILSTLCLHSWSNEDVKYLLEFASKHPDNESLLDVESYKFICKAFAKHSCRDSLLWGTFMRILPKGYDEESILDLSEHKLNLKCILEVIKNVPTNVTCTIWEFVYKLIQNREKINFMNSNIGSDIEQIPPSQLQPMLEKIYEILTVPYEWNHQNKFKLLSCVHGLIAFEPYWNLCKWEPRGTIPPLVKSSIKIFVFQNEYEYKHFFLRLETFGSSQD